VLPKLAEQVEAFLNIAPLTWTDAWAPLPAGHAINEYQHLMTRIDPKKIEIMVEENKQSLAPAPKSPPRAIQACRAPTERSQGGSRGLAGNRSSASTTSPKSICASPASPTPNTSKAPTSCSS
jgi:hypothetical protein